MVVYPALGSFSVLAFNFYFDVALDLVWHVTDHDGNLISQEMFGIVTESTIGLRLCMFSSVVCGLCHFLMLAWH